MEKPKIDPQRNRKTTECYFPFTYQEKALKTCSMFVDGLILEQKMPGKIDAFKRDFLEQH